MKTILGQILSIIAMTIAIMAFQCKSNKKLFILQGLSGFVFFVSYIFFGAYTAAAVNIININRGLTFGLAPKKNQKYLLILLEMAYIVSALLTFKGFYSGLILVCQLVGTVAMICDNKKVFRFVQLLWISPIWLIYNIHYFSIGGILCEVFTQASILVSLLRYGINGFEK